jgi:hypothetical protein
MKALQYKSNKMYMCRRKAESGQEIFERRKAESKRFLEESRL